MTTTTPRHARPRRSVLTQYIRTRIERRNAVQAMLAREEAHGVADVTPRLDVPRQWRPSDTLDVVTGWRDAWAGDPDRTTRRESVR